MEIRFGMEYEDLVDEIQSKDGIAYRHGMGVIDVRASVFSEEILNRSYVQVLDDEEYEEEPEPEGSGEEIVRCQGITSDGEQCERNVDVSDGSPPYCYQHIDQA